MARRRLLKRNNVFNFNTILILNSLPIYYGNTQSYGNISFLLDIFEFHITSLFLTFDYYVKKSSTDNIFLRTA